MNRELETPAPLKDASELQHRLSDIAHLERLEDFGIHIHTITKALDPTEGKVLAEEAHDLRSNDQKPSTKPL